ncbi:hypothetical protein K8I61_07420 [bacterium]|nr:hypothetical protein [bacterium]
MRKREGEKVWKSERLEGWKAGRLEGWKAGRPERVFVILSVAKDLLSCRHDARFFASLRMTTMRGDNNERRQQRAATTTSGDNNAGQQQRAATTTRDDRS